MNQREFKQEIYTRGNTREITEQTITERLEINSSFQTRGLIVKSCTFKEPVIFSNIDLLCGIKFIDCKFEKSITFNNCKFSDYDNTFNFSGYNLEFQKTNIKQIYFNDKNNIERGVKFYDNCIIDNLIINTIISDKGGILIENTTVNSKLDISQTQLSGDLAIRQNSIINCKVRYENNFASSIVFTESTFNKDIHIWAGKVNNLTFNHGTFKDDLTITVLPIKRILTIIGANFNKTLSINLHENTSKKIGSISKIHIQSGKFGEQFIIEGKNDLIDDLTIKTSKQLEGAIYFNRLNIKKTEISGDNYNSNIVFNHSNFNQLHFNYFYNYSNLSIISALDFDSNSSFIISHSNLGKTHLFNVTLNNFDEVKITNSILTEIITANITWFSDSQLNLNQNLSRDAFNQRKEIYRQLKYSQEKQGNKIDLLHFKSLEMENYKEELFFDTKWYNSLFDKDRFIVWLGKTNDYGLNWIKPVLYAVFFSWLFHILITIEVSDSLSFYPNFTWDSLKQTYSTYRENWFALPQLMNPTHILTRIYETKKTLSTTTYAFDYLLKIILAFFIFQIISAFRKFSK